MDNDFFRDFVARLLDNGDNKSFLGFFLLFLTPGDFRVVGVLDFEEVVGIGMATVPFGACTGVVSGVLVLGDADASESSFGVCTGTVSISSSSSGGGGGVDFDFAFVFVLDFALVFSGFESSASAFEPSFDVSTVDASSSSGGVAFDFAFDFAFAFVFPGFESSPSAFESCFGVGTGTVLVSSTGGGVDFTFALFLAFAFAFSGFESSASWASKEKVMPWAFAHWSFRGGTGAFPAPHTD